MRFPYSRRGRIIDLYSRGTVTTMSRCMKDFLTMARIWLDLFTASEVWLWNLSWSSTITPRSFSWRTCSRLWPFNEYTCLPFVLPEWRDLYFPMVNGSCHLLPHSAMLSISDCNSSTPVLYFTQLYTKVSLVSSAKKFAVCELLNRVHHKFASILYIILPKRTPIDKFLNKSNSYTFWKNWTIQRQMSKSCCHSH